jgi:hypothetical protein
MTFRSRRDKPVTIMYFAVILLSFFLITYSVLNILEKNGEIFLAIFNGLVGLVAAFLIIVIYVSTFYELRNKMLFIRSGPFTDEIKYNKIDKLEVVNSLVFGAALARNRIRLHCGVRKNGRPNIVYISPENQDDFIRRLLKYAPNIEVISK